MKNDGKEVLCNLCGLSCKFGCKENEMFGPHGLIKQAVYGGYESTAGNGHGALDDTTGYRFSLCEFCLDWLFGKFKVPVETFEYDCFDGSDLMETEAWKPADQRVREEEWRKDKKEFFEEFEKRNKARSIK
jgi:hypothetical protein